MDGARERVMPDRRAGAGAVSAFQRLCRTPMRDVVRARLTGRLDMDAMITAAELPDPLPQLVRDVVRRTRLYRLEKVVVAEELVGHFRDGLIEGAPADELARDFGDPVQAARLIGRAKRRNRPLAYRVSTRSAVILYSDARSGREVEHAL